VADGDGAASSSAGAPGWLAAVAQAGAAQCGELLLRLEEEMHALQRGAANEAGADEAGEDGGAAGGAAGGGGAAGSPAGGAAGSPAGGAAGGGLEARQGGRLPGRLWPSVEAREHWRGFAQRAATSAQQAHALHCLRDHAAAFGLMGKKEARPAMDRCSLQWRLTEDAGWA